MQRRSIFKLIPVALACAGTLAFSAGASAQAFPNRPIRFVVPFTAGSATDIVARAVADGMTATLGQPVVIDNRPGAGGSIGANMVAKAPADGYTLLVHSAGHAVNPAIYAKLPFDTLADFAGVTPLATLPNVVVVAPSKGYNSMKDIVAAAKAKPGTLNFGSAGSGSATHINAEKFRAVAGYDAVHVPYKGTPEAITETIAGRLDYFFAPIVSALPMIRDGKLKALAVGSAKRSELLPNVPTTVEAGYPGSDFNFWVGMMAPAGAPKDVMDKLHDAAVKAAESTTTRARLYALGASPFVMKPAEFDAYIKQEVLDAAKITKAAGIKPQ
jgi:tripartite-type tricarboxylate transporter receptor subunit TctC